MEQPAFTFLDTRELAKRTYLLLSDFTRVDEKFGKITAAKDFVTNYASIDVLNNMFTFLIYALLIGYGDKSATIHDWLYSGYGILREDGTIYYPTREECDEIFYRSLLAEKVHPVRAKIFYKGVRLFGAKNYTAQATFVAPTPEALVSEALVPVGHTEFVPDLTPAEAQAEAARNTTA